MRVAYLSSDADLSIFLESDGWFPRILIIKHNRNTRLRNSSLSPFIYQILQVLSSHSAHIRDPQHKTYRIQDIRFPGPVQSLFPLAIPRPRMYSDGIEGWVPFIDGGSDGVALEAVDDEFFDLHLRDEEGAGWRAGAKAVYSGFTRCCVYALATVAIRIAQETEATTCDWPRPRANQCAPQIDQICGSRTLLWLNRSLFCINQAATEVRLGATECYRISVQINSYSGKTYNSWSTVEAQWMSEIYNYSAQILLSGDDLSLSLATSLRTNSVQQTTHLHCYTQTTLHNSKESAKYLGDRNTK